MTAGFACHALLWCTGLQMARVQSALQWRDLAYTFASAALAMAVGMTLILKALQHGSAGFGGHVVVGIAGAAAAAAVVAHRATPCRGAW